MSFRSEVYQRPDGRYQFVAVEDNLVFHFVKVEPDVQFTDAELLALKLKAMDDFDKAAAP